jgi:arsenite/tail-anchored protein-transporting ATPase
VTRRAAEQSRSRSRQGSRSGATQHFQFWSGKGGVGKTTCAVAAALQAVERGVRVLLVSTDPAHSLADALALGSLSATPRPVPLPRGGSPGRGRLVAAEIAAAPGLRRWLRRWRPALAAIAEHGTVLTGADFAPLFALEPPGIDELGGLLELARLAAASGCAEVVVDTAPTAHTLRLLAVPELLAGVAETFAALRRTPQLLAAHFGVGVEQGGEERAVAELAGHAAALHDLLRDRDRCSFVWVSLAEELAVAEAEDGVRALAGSGIEVREIVLNRLIGPSRARATRCRSCRARRTAELAAVARARRSFVAHPLRLLPEHAVEPRGLAALTRLAAELGDPRRGGRLAPPTLRAREATGGSPAPAADVRHRPTGATELVERWGKAQLVLFGGKGGVGKSTCAAAAALALAAARPREPILLVSADPAHSLADVYRAPLDDRPRNIQGAPRNLWVRELDAPAVFSAWQARSGAQAEALLESLSTSWRIGEASTETPTGRDLLGWIPAGLDELVGILSLLDALLGDEGVANAPVPRRSSPGRPVRGPTPARFSRVLVDTAPTGHALRLLAMPELALAWDHALLGLLLKYREAVAADRFARELLGLASRLKRLLALLRDPDASRFVVVSRPAEMVVPETRRLLTAVAGLGIAVEEMIVNSVVTGRCATCRPQAAAQAAPLSALHRIGAQRRARRGCAIIHAPALFAPPRGVERLRVWSLEWNAESL